MVRVCVQSVVKVTKDGGICFDNKTIHKKRWSSGRVSAQGYANRMCAKKQFLAFHVSPQKRLEVKNPQEHLAGPSALMPDWSLQGRG